MATSEAVSLLFDTRGDSASNSALPIATDHGIQVIGFCSQGYTSSLAAAVLPDLGPPRTMEKPDAYLNIVRRTIPRVERGLRCASKSEG
jgi:hypothetical protein